MKKKKQDPKYATLWKLMADPNLSASAKCVGVALLLKYRNNKTGRCDPSFIGLADIVGRSRRAVIDAITELKKAQWLEVKGKRGCRNHYVLTPPPVQSAAPVPVQSTAPVQSAALGECSPLHPNHLENHLDKGVAIFPPRPPPVGAADEFEVLRQLWRRPYGTDVVKARAAFDSVVASGVPAAEIIASAERWVAAKEPDKLQALEKWLEHGAWEHEPPPRRAGAARGGKTNPVHAMLNAGGFEGFGHE